MGSIAIAANGVLVYQKAIGYSQVNEKIKTPATIKTKYRIGSVSKMFTSVMIFQLIDEGKLGFDTPLATYFPQLPNAQKITISQMLDHRSGLRSVTADPLFTTYMASPKSEAEMIAIMARLKPDFEPDAKAIYSNTNFVLLGYIIEKVTGKTYAEELKERIASKIGLTDTYYGAKINPVKNEAYSYNYAGQWIPEVETDMSIPGGSGAVVSTSTDLVKFIDALFTGKLISPAGLERMRTIRDGYGMDMVIIPFNDKKGYGHGGNIDAFSSMLVYFPQDKVSIAYICNGARGPSNDVWMNALTIYFNKPFTIPVFKDAKTISLTTAELDQYVGKYSSVQIPLNFAISKRNTTLYAQTPGQDALPVEVPLDPRGDGKFVHAVADVPFQFEPAKKTFTLTLGKTNYLFTKVN